MCGAFSRCFRCMTSVQTSRPRPFLIAQVPDAVNIFLHYDALPKGDTGKLDKKGLRAKYAAVVEARPKTARL